MKSIRLILTFVYRVIVKISDSELVRIYIDVESARYWSYKGDTEFYVVILNLNKGILKFMQSYTEVKRAIMKFVHLY